MRRLRYSSFLNQTGDTIVEVLIAAAVIGLVLTGAYTVSNVSLKQIQSSQERGEATKVAATAMERLSSAVKLPANAALTTSASAPSPFCFDSSLNVVTLPNPSCTDGRYSVSIVRDSADSSKKLFNVRVTWDGLAGVTEQMNFSYYVSTL